MDKSNATLEIQQDRTEREDGDGKSLPTGKRRGGGTSRCPHGIIKLEANYSSNLVRLYNYVEKNGPGARPGGPPARYRSPTGASATASRRHRFFGGEGGFKKSPGAIPFKARRGEARLDRVGLGTVRAPDPVLPLSPRPPPGTFGCSGWFFMNTGMIIIPIFLCGCRSRKGKGRGYRFRRFGRGLRGWVAHEMRRTGGNGSQTLGNMSRRLLDGIWDIPGNSPLRIRVLN